MPGTVYTPFNPGGQSYVPEVESFNAKRAAQMAALSQQGQIAGAEIADRGAGRDWQADQSALDRTQQANIAGTFGQRSAQDMQMEQLRQGGQMDIAKLNDTGMTERANIGITPQMANIGLLGRMYGDTRADTADERGLKHRAFQELTGGGGNPMASSASIDALKSAAGGDPAATAAVNGGGQGGGQGGGMFDSMTTENRTAIFLALAGKGDMGAALMQQGVQHRALQVQMAQQEAASAKQRGDLPAYQAATQRIYSLENLGVAPQQQFTETEKLAPKLEASKAAEAFASNPDIANLIQRMKALKDEVKSRENPLWGIGSPIRATKEFFTNSSPDFKARYQALDQYIKQAAAAHNISPEDIDAQVMKIMGVDESGYGI